MIRRIAGSQGAVAAVMLAPAIICVIVLRLVPAGWAMISSLRHTSLLEQATTWAGLGNFGEALSDPGFRRTLAVTGLFNLIINPLQVVVALGLAMLLSRRLPGVRLARALIFMPIAVPPAVSAVVWGIALQPDGLVNAVLSAVGIGRQPFLTSPGQAMYAIIVMLSWTGVGYWMLFLIAGLQDIPRSYYEAAAIDGASGRQIFLRITLPLLRRPLAFVLVATTVANMLTFAPVQILTGGGPEGSTNLLMFDVYTQAYQMGDLNQAEAKVVLLVLVLSAITAVQFWMLRAKD